MLERLRRVVDREPSVCECRHCGTNVDSVATECSTCGSGDIVCYQL
jgi:Zn finger protein HypA/HybF involved in hydrogenase expression